MKDLLISVLETICPNNVFLQGTLNGDESYPESFITFWVDSTDDNSHYDNGVHSIDWSFSVIFYSSNPELIQTKAAEIRTKLIAAGFIADGRGNDMPSDQPSHTGWAMDFSYVETITTT